VPAGDPPPNGFFCGPQVWGEGLVDPPPGSWPPAGGPGAGTGRLIEVSDEIG
jgi:hypothetical protein